jgi:cholesterol transport system auxiliary component
MNTAPWNGIFGAVVMLTLVACVRVNVEQRPNPARRYFVLDASGNSIASQANSSGVLKLAPVRVAYPYDSKGFIYRIASESFETDFYNQFLVAPGPMLSDELRQALGQANLFQAVVNSTSVVEATHLLEGTVDELYGDFSADDPGKAVLALSFVMRPQAAGEPQAIFRKQYEKAIPLKARSPEGLVQGWNRALEQIIVELVADLKTTTRSPDSAERSRSPL